MSKLTASYLAGFIDGEGYLGLHPSKRGKKDRIYYQPTLTVASTDEFIIRWMKESYGGSCYERIPKNLRHKNSLSWTLNGRKLKPFLQKICPYLRLKKKQCQLLLKKIKIQETLMKDLPYPEISKINQQREQKRISNLAYRDGQRKKIEAIYEELRRLNKRGKETFAR